MCHRGQLARRILSAHAEKEVNASENRGAVFLFCFFRLALPHRFERDGPLGQADVRCLDVVVTETLAQANAERGSGQAE